MDSTLGGMFSYPSNVLRSGQDLPLPVSVIPDTPATEDIAFSLNLRNVQATVL